MTVKANKRTYAIGLILMTGWTPWGELRSPRPVLIGAKSGLRPVQGWVMRGGHVLWPHEMARWEKEGLVQPGEPDRLGRPTMVAGPGLAEWLSAAFRGLKARTWGNPA